MNKIYEDLSKQNPLNMSKALLSYEIYNNETAEEMFKKIDEEFESKEGKVNRVFDTIIYGLANSLIRKTKIKTPIPRLVQEIKDFSYEQDSVVNTYYQNTRVDDEFNYSETKEFKRESIDNAYNRTQYKGSKSEDGRFVKDEYTGERLYVLRSDAEWENYDNINNHTTDVDHIIPLVKYHESVKHNIALSEEDIREIANMEENYVNTNSTLNRKKSGNLNSEFVNEHKDELSDKTKKNMLEKEKIALKTMNSAQNKKVISNLKEDLKGDKTILKATAKEAVEGTKNKASGLIKDEIFILFAKVSIYEIKDSLINTITHGTPFNTVGEAIKFRVKRAIQYIKDSVKKLFSNVMGSLFMDLLRNFAQLFFNLFAGIVKIIGQIIVKGFHSLVQALKLIFMPPKNMTKSEIADAVTKLIVSTLVSVGIVAVGEKFQVPEAIIIILEAISVGLVMYVLDKVDLFGAKIDKRRARLKEVFELRIQEIKESTEEFAEVSIHVIAKQKMDFLDLINSMNISLEGKSIEKALEGAYKIAENFGIILPFNDTESFVNFFDNEEIISF